MPIFFKNKKVLNPTYPQVKFRTYKREGFSEPSFLTSVFIDMLKFPKKYKIKMIYTEA